MELLQLKYFLELARTEHLSRTAQKLMISPPSLSSTIKKLENELGVKLFDRSKQRIYLNENGKQFYSYVEQAIGLLDTGVALFKPEETVKVLSVAMTSQPIYSNMLFEYEHSVKNIQVKSSVIQIDELDHAKMAADYQFYLGIIEDIDTNYFDYRQLFPSEKPVVILSKNHPLAKENSLSLPQLKNEAFISVLRENSSAHRFVERIFQQGNFHPRKMYYGGYLMRVKMVAENKAVAITTKVGASVNAMPLDSIAIVPLTGVPFTRTQAVCWKKGRRLSAMEEDFIQFAIRYFQKNPLIDPMLL